MSRINGNDDSARRESSVRHDLSLARVDSDARGADEQESEVENEETPLSWNLILRLFTYTRPYAPKRNWLFVLVIIRGIQIPCLAWALSAVINGPIMAGDSAGTMLGALGFGALALLTQLTMHFRQRFALELGEGVVHDLRNAVYTHLMSMPMSFFQKTKLGRIISRITSDIEAVRGGVQNVFFVGLVQSAQMIGSGILMLFYNWILFSMLLVMAPGIYAINRYFRRRIGQSSRELQESMSRVTASIAETVRGIRVTQGFVREDVNADLFRRLVADHATYNLGLARHVAVYIPLLELNSQFFIAMILLVGGFGVLHPDLNMQIGDLIAFFFLANLFFTPISALGRLFTQALNSMAGAERIFRLLDTKPEWEDDSDAVDIDKIRGKVEFHNVGFHYNPDEPVLQDISFTAREGETFALVGHTGSGKSTIVNLLSKFYIPVSGQVLIDDRDIRKITSRSLHEHLGLVLQANFLFNGTVADNIRLGKLDATEEEIHEACRSLDCYDLFEAMPNGFDTPVGERGGGLSMGQQQLVCFARAMLADPRILILDEATSSVDTMTEARLQGALAHLLSNRTSFVVAHRLSTIRNADQVLVLDHGRLIEQGTHEELLLLNGTYAELYRQFAQSDEHA